MAYTEPTVADLVTRYPAFALVPISTVEMYLADAAGGADDSWLEADFIPGRVALAAHMMAVTGLGTQTEVQKFAAAGLRSVRSGSFSADFTDSAASRAAGGGLDATPYGRAYKVLLKRNRGGPRLVGGGIASAAWGDYGGICNDGSLP